MPNGLASQYRRRRRWRMEREKTIERSQEIPNWRFRRIDSPRMKFFDVQLRMGGFDGQLIEGWSEF